MIGLFCVIAEVTEWWESVGVLTSIRRAIKNYYVGEYKIIIDWIIILVSYY